MTDKKQPRKRLKNRIKKTDEPDIWCSTCGDRTYYANLEKRELTWFLKDESRGVGICDPCAKVLDKKYLVLPDE